MKLFTVTYESSSTRLIVAGSLQEAIGLFRDFALKFNVDHEPFEVREVPLVAEGISGLIDGDGVFFYPH